MAVTSDFGSHVRNAPFVPHSPANLGLDGHDLSMKVIACAVRDASMTKSKAVWDDQSGLPVRWQW